MPKPCPVSVQVSTYWWDEAADRDIPSNCCHVTIWVHKGSTGIAFHHNCHTPQELWDYMHELNTDFAAVMKEEFYFTSDRNVIPADLNDLFK